MVTKPASSLRAAAVKIDITPPVGATMAGYAARTGASQGIHDPLQAGLLLMEAPAGMDLLVSMDIIGTSLAFTQQVRQAIHQEIGVPPEGILLACSHTHSGPVGLVPTFPGIDSEQNPAYMQSVAEQLIGAARWAKTRLEPARLGFASGNLTGLGSNRNDPDSLQQDRQVIVLTVENLTGEPIAVWMNYGCHPTILGHENLLISADYPGAARDSLTRHYPETIFLFTNGASGDISTRFTRREQGFAEVTRMGRLLAGEVLKLLQLIQYTDDTTLIGKIAHVDLPFRVFPSPEGAEAELERQRQELEHLVAEEAQPGAIRKAITRVEGSQAQLGWSLHWKEFDNTGSEMQALRIGPLGIVGVPGEAFTRTVLDIKGDSPASLTAVVSYANDYRGYFPDPVSIRQGNYETFISPYDERAVTFIREEAVTYLKKVFNE